MLILYFFPQVVPLKGQKYTGNFCLANKHATVKESAIMIVKYMLINKVGVVKNSCLIIDKLNE